MIREKASHTKVLSCVVHNNNGITMVITVDRASGPSGPCVNSATSDSESDIENLYKMLSKLCWRLLIWLIVAQAVTAQEETNKRIRKRVIVTSKLSLLNGDIDISTHRQVELILV